MTSWSHSGIWLNNEVINFRIDILLFYCILGVNKKSKMDLHMIKKLFLSIFLVVSVYLLAPAPEASAMEPVTMVALAPVAIEVAKVAAPYVIQGMRHLVVGLVDMGKDMIDIFRLPLGFFQSTFLGPFGFFYDGLKNLVKGGIAPFKLCLDALLLPVRPFGAVL